MDINQYSIYSVLSSNEDKNGQELKNVLSIIEKINTLKDYESINSYLINELHLTNGRCNLNGCFIETQSQPDKQIVNIKFKNENYIYYYKK